MIMKQKFKKTQILVVRYKSILSFMRPDVRSKKDENGSLDLKHISWMLDKMSDPSFVNKSCDEAWISWVQASLYANGLIDIKHEIDITREVMNRPD